MQALAWEDRHMGTAPGLVDTQARDAWEQDVRAGKAALLIADTGEQVNALNEQIRAARIRTGETSTGREAMLADD
jgi:hypothetical protein